MDFVAIDVETANARLGSICQIGVAGYKQGELVAEWVTFVDPEDFFDPVNVSIHGIDGSDVIGAPTLPQIIEDLDSWLAGRVAVCHTHFDRVAVHQACDTYELPVPECTWLDSARVARRTWDQFSRSGYGLQNLCDHLGYCYDAHDALEDAKASAVVLLRAVETTGLSIEDWLTRVERPINPSMHAHEPIVRAGNPDGPLFGEVVVFTGSLRMVRREAADIADAIGCQVDPGVTRHTTILIVGDQDVSKLAGHDKSSKHRKAEQLISAGQPIRILRESDFVSLARLESASRRGGVTLVDRPSGDLNHMHFGYNCQSYLPTLGKCRVLVDLRRRRQDLVAPKWMEARDLLVYTGYSPQQLIDGAESGNVGVKRLKNGRLLFQIPTSWDWDDCPLSDTGGQCLHFEAHAGWKIGCIRDLDGDHAGHPNLQLVPSAELVNDVEAHFMHVVATSRSASCRNGVNLTARR